MGEKRQKANAKCAKEDETRDPDYDARDLEYVKAMLDYVKDDARQDYVRVTGALALAAIFVTQVRISELQRLNRFHTWMLFAGLFCLVLAATAYFTYVQETHLARRSLSSYLLTLDTRKLRCEAQELFQRRSRLIRFHAGNLLFLVGVLLLGDVLWVLVTSSH
jgi:hypothetical protein